MAESSEKTEKLLSLLVLQGMRDQTMTERAAVLSRVGFDNAEIAKLLGTDAHTIAQTLYKVRGAGKKTKKRNVAKKGTRGG